MLTITLFGLVLIGVDHNPVRPLVAKHAEPVLRLALSPDRTQLASLSRDGVMIIWDAKSHLELRRFTSPRQAIAIRWAQPDRLISVGTHGLVTLSPSTGKVIFQSPIQNRCDTGAISIDGRFAAVANTHFVGQLIDGKSICPYPAPAEWSYAMAISPDNNVLAVAGRNPGPDAIYLFETKDFTPIRHWQCKIKNAFDLTFSSDGLLVASVGDGKQVNVWNTTMGELTDSLPLAEEGAVAVAFSPNGKTLAIGSGVPVEQLAGNHFEVLPDYKATVARPQSSRLQVWNLDSKKEIWRSDALTSWVTTITYLPQSNILVSGHQDGSVRFWTLPHQ